MRLYERKIEDDVRPSAPLAAGFAGVLFLIFYHVFAQISVNFHRLVPPGLEYPLRLGAVVHFEFEFHPGGSVVHYFEHHCIRTVVVAKVVGDVVLLLAVRHEIFLDVGGYLLAYGKRDLIVKAFKALPSVRSYLISRLRRARTGEIHKIIRLDQVVESGFAEDGLYPVVRGGYVIDNALYESHVALVEYI